MRVLSVDDEPANHELMSAILTGHGYRVDRAYNGIEALDMAGRFHYEIIITDIEMPGMNGLSFYSNLLEKKPLMAKRVIFVTADLEKAAGLFIKDAGCPFMLKPIKSSELLKAVDDVIEGGCKGDADGAAKKWKGFPSFPFWAVLMVFLSLLDAGVSPGGSSVDHELCKECHEDVHQEALGMPYRHMVVDEKCGMCHMPGKRMILYTTEVASPDFKTEVLFPLTISAADKVYFVEVIAKDNLGRKSKVHQLYINPQEVNEFLSNLPVEGIRDIMMDNIAEGIFLEAALSFSTDVYTAGSVEYGATAGYGETSPEEATYSKEHRVTLSNLKKDYTYHFRIAAKDIYGNQVRSEDAAFYTGALSGAKEYAQKTDYSFPAIEDMRVLKKAEVAGAGGGSGSGFFILVTSSKPVRLSIRIAAQEEKEARHGDGFYPPKVSRINICVTCHPQGVSHPVGISADTLKTRVPLNLPTLEGGIITCVTCHLPHGGEKKYFARLDFQRDICIECHTVEPFI